VHKSDCSLHNEPESDVEPCDCGLLKSFEEISRPLIKFLNDNCNPHFSVIVTTTGAELVSGEMAYNTNDFVRD